MFECFPTLVTLLLILSVLADLEDELVEDFLSNSDPESESDSTSSELFGFFGVFRVFLLFDDDAAEDDVVEAGDVAGIFVVCGNFSSGFGDLARSTITGTTISLLSTISSFSFSFSFSTVLGSA